MLLDCHVHTGALRPGDGHISAEARRSLAFRLLRRQLGVPDDRDDVAMQRRLEDALFRTLDGAPEVDAVVVLAFDAVYTRDGNRDDAATHFWVSNDYVAELARRHPKIRFGASVHPYRPDAAAEVARCARAGAVLCKWLPITQRFDPADTLCAPVYDALASVRLPLLCHTGWEHVLPKLDRTVAAPARLVPALERGVTVIAAHCGSGRVPGEGLYLEQFCTLARTHPRLFGDTSALNLPGRWRSYATLMADDVVKSKLIHGSDWPVPAYPRPWDHKWSVTRSLLRECNTLRRDVLIKRELGFDEEYWSRGARLLLDRTI